MCADISRDGWSLCSRRCAGVTTCAQRVGWKLCSRSSDGLANVVQRSCLQKRTVGEFALVVETVWPGSLESGFALVFAVFADESQQQ